MERHGTSNADNEEARLNALRDLRLLDTPPSESFDRFTRLASRLMGAPVAAVSLTDGDRQWFKSKVGMDISEIPRHQAPCSYAIQGQDILVVPDLMADPRFVDSPLTAAGIRFYAGAPLFTRSGHGLGTICVVDDKPRTITEDERGVLRDLACMVINQIELQTMVGRIDATSGFVNQHEMFEVLADLALHAPGAEMWGVLVDVHAGEESVDGARVLGTDYVDTLMKGVLGNIGLAFGNTASLFHVGATRCALLLSPETSLDLESARARIFEVLQAPVFCNGVPIAPSPAIGTCLFRNGDLAPRDVLRRLINAVEDARWTESRVAEYCPLHDSQTKRRFSLLNDFQAALDATDQLSLHYQPRIELADGSCAGAEALLRWRHPTLGPVSPGEFVPAVEGTALSRPMTEWVMSAAIRQTLAWDQTGVAVKVSINASARNLDESDFADRLIAAIEAVRLDPARLELEFTESAMARDSSRVIAQLTRLRDFGLDIAIDDFGTGYSNLAYLQQLPATVLKIDRAFVAHLDSSVRDQKLVRMVITMAHDIGYRVVAEGIETRAVYEMLRDWGCDEGQGYLMARPMPAADLPGWLGLLHSAPFAA